jgi:uncharacterized protein (DUF1697 family)
MTTYAALLHSFILGSGKRVVMSILRNAAMNAGFQNPRTLGATGNLLIDHTDAFEEAEVEILVERAIEKGFGKHIDVIVRTGGDWLDLTASNPFLAQSALDASRVIVRVMRAPLAADAADALKPWRGSGDRIEVVNGDLWIAFAGPPSQSRLLSRLTVKHMGVGTTRNWNTVRGLAGMIEG